MQQDFLPTRNNEEHPASQETIDFIHDVYGESTFNGLISLDMRDEKKTFRHITSVDCSSLAKYVCSMSIHENRHYYISANSFTKAGRGKNKLFGLHNIVADVDLHDSKMPLKELDQKIENLIWRLKNDCFILAEIPTPNYIIVTGRGVQLWWCLIPAFAAQFSDDVSKISRFFTTCLAEFLSEFPSELNDFHVDTAASNNLAGIYRLPGSINPKCQKKVETIHLHNNRLELKGFWKHCLFISEAASHIQNNQNRFKFYGGTTDFEAVAERRIEAIRQLRDMRHALIGEETRNDYCFMHFVTLASVFGTKEAYQRTQRFNQGFLQPLTEKELKSTLSSAFKKDYKFTNKKLIEFLGITDDEANILGLHIAVPHPSKASVKAKKDARNEKIIVLYRSGHTQVEISEQLGLNRKTVSTVIHQNTIDKSTQIQALQQEGKSTSDIAEIMGCSMRTVQRHLSKLAGSVSTAGKMKLSLRSDKMSKNSIYGGEEGEQKEAASPTLGIAALPTSAVDMAKLPNNPQIQDRADPYGPFYRGDMSFIENDSLAADVEDTTPARLEAAALGTLMLAEERDGNLYINQAAMKYRMNHFLRLFSAPGRNLPPLTDQQVFDACNALCRKGLVVADRSAAEGTCYFLKANHTNEAGAVKLLSAMIDSQPKYTLDTAVIPMVIQQYEKETGLTLSAGQKDAIRLALTNPVAVITGGPGTGKSSTMAALCRVLQITAPIARVKLCAPTGKAAVHLAEVTGVPAKTIHALKASKIHCDWLIIDEASMVDVSLLHDILQVVCQGAHVLFVGDPDQLPCIGAGNVLRDLLLSKRVPVVQLSQVYRQGEQSGIVKYANAIRGAQDGIQLPDSDSTADDTCFIPLQDASAIEQKVTEIAGSLKKAGFSDSDIQVLAPTREWTGNLNAQLKSVFNPGTRGCKSDTFAVGDRVIYTENDYARNLHNGQTGTVVSTTKSTLIVDYGGQTVCHKKAAMEHLELAYAMTIHKAQGSEFPVVIIPVHGSMGPVLSRNLIYTAITRAKTKCIMVGSEQALRTALGRTLTGTHQSLLSERLNQI